MDPLSQALQLLGPQALTWKEAECRGDWGLRFPAHAGAAFCLVATGSCRLERAGEPPIRLAAGDFVLLTAPPAWTLSEGAPKEITDGVVGLGQDRLRARLGAPDDRAPTRIVGGHFGFRGAHDALLTGLLPAMVHIPASDFGAGRLRGVLDLIAAEAFADRPGRAMVLERLLDIMLVEAIRQVAGEAHPGLLAGLADPQVAMALRALHGDPSRAWTVAELAAAAGASRSAFAARFGRVVGISPIDYLVSWRMALAKDALRRGGQSLSEIAFACGYQSASAFSTAFRRVVGGSPARYARERRASR
jgi:AraC-like DNA-binding protein